MPAKTGFSPIERGDKQTRKYGPTTRRRATVRDRYADGLPVMRWRVVCWPETATRYGRAWDDRRPIVVYEVR